jgi:hypothetical protein
MLPWSLALSALRVFEVGNVFDLVDPQERLQLDGIGRQIEDVIGSRKHVKNDDVLSDRVPFLTSTR